MTGKEQKELINLVLTSPKAMTPIERQEARDLMHRWMGELRQADKETQGEGSQPTMLQLPGYGFPSGGQGATGMNETERCHLKILMAKPPEEHNLSTASFVIDLIGQYLKELAEKLEGMGQVES